MTKKQTRERATDLRLQREFGITLEQYTAVLKHQGGKCAICKRPVKDFKNRLSVDHCHTTGLVRGLLCWGCNKAIAVFKDDVDRLNHAATYLLKPPFTVVLLKDTYTVPGRVGTKKRAKLLAALKALRLKEKL